MSLEEEVMLLLGHFHQYMKQLWKKWLNELVDAFSKAAEALPVIVGSVVGVILSRLGKAVGFAAEHVWTVIVFVAGLIGV